MYVMLMCILSEHYLQIKFDPTAFAVTAIAHPHTYLNKIILGSQQGTLQLWNIKSNKLIYTFPGWGSPVTAIQQVKLCCYLTLVLLF